MYVGQFVLSGALNYVHSDAQLKTVSKSWHLNRRKEKSEHDIKRTEEKLGKQRRKCRLRGRRRRGNKEETKEERKQQQQSV
jgi:hypothetical protein